MHGMYLTHLPSKDKDDSSDGKEIFTEKFTLSTESTGQIAKPLTKSMEHLPHMAEWRRDLKVDSKVDYLSRVDCSDIDSVDKWWGCTVLEVDPGSNRIKIHYDGWSSIYDEWISR